MNPFEDPAEVRQALDGYRGFFQAIATDAACLETIGTQSADATITSKIARVSARDQLAET